MNKVLREAVEEGFMSAAISVIFAVYVSLVVFVFSVLYVILGPSFTERLLVLSVVALGIAIFLVYLWAREISSPPRSSRPHIPPLVTNTGISGMLFDEAPSDPPGQIPENKRRLFHSYRKASDLR
jgi:hypothetical protein